MGMSLITNFSLNSLTVGDVEVKSIDIIPEGILVCHHFTMKAIQ